MTKTFLITLLIFVNLNSTYGQNPQLNDINIGQKTFEFFDDSRDRKLVTEVWYPTHDSFSENDKAFSPFKRELTVRDAKTIKGQYPLVLFSHGNGGSRLSMEWLAQSLVKSGYIVAAVDHWGNTHDNKIGIEFLKPWERPLDITSILTRLLEDQTFGKSINPDRIGALGFSFGGHTVITLAGAVTDYPALLNYTKTEEGLKDLSNIREFPNLADLINGTSLLEMTENLPALKDPRIKSFFAISPGTAQGFKDKSQFKDVTDPIFIVGCQADKVTPVIRYARYYHSFISQSDYFEFGGEVGHYVMLAEANDAVKKEAPAVFVDHPSVHRNEVHQKVTELATNFFNRNLK